MPCINKLIWSGHKLKISTYNITNSSYIFDDAVVMSGYEWL